VKQICKKKSILLFYVILYNEWISLRNFYLIGLELGAHAPALVISERVPILLEEGVDARYAAVPRVLQILQGEPAVLGGGLLAFERVLRPHALRVDELRLPGLHVPVQVGDQLVLLVAHTRPSN